MGGKEIEDLLAGFIQYIFSVDQSIYEMMNAVYL